MKDKINEIEIAKRKHILSNKLAYLSYSCTPC